MPWSLENEQLKTLMGEWPFSQMTKLGNLHFDCFFSPTEIGPASEPMQQDTNLTALAFPGLV